jgi:CDP-glucose 4,6-dehydratase
MENMEVNSRFWTGRRVLLTGHTGFKGAWLALWLTRLGAKVYGYSLAPSSNNNLYVQAKLTDLLAAEVFRDIRSFEEINRFLGEAAPDCIFHLAAQAEVKESYRDPRETFSINIQGTVTLLDALRHYTTPVPVVIVTSDKCYRNNDSGRSFIESDAIGGGDPYSTSKACQEMISESMVDAFFSSDGRFATARAGNVVGGGDWASHRLVPDVVRAWRVNETLQLRYPSAVRPWQHVLDVVSGYARLAEWLTCEATSAFSTFNFGPRAESSISVHSFVENFCRELGRKIPIQTCSPAGKEAVELRLDASKAHDMLSWRPIYSLAQTISETADWYRNVEEGQVPRDVSFQTVDRFVKEIKIKE